MINLLLKLLDKIPYRTHFGLSISDELKHLYYDKIGQYKRPKKCLCGGNVYNITVFPDGWEISCSSCGFLVDED